MGLFKTITICTTLVLLVFLGMHIYEHEKQECVIYHVDYHRYLTKGNLDMSFLNNKSITINEILFKFENNLTHDNKTVCGLAYIESKKVKMNIDCLQGIASLFQLCNHEVFHIKFESDNEEEQANWLERAYWAKECVMLLDWVVEYYALNHEFSSNK